jgi:hypothetical protein
MCHGVDIPSNRSCQRFHQTAPVNDIAKPQHSVEIIKGVHIFDLSNQGTGTIEVTTFQEPLLVESFLELADETLQGAELAVVANIVKSSLEIEEKAECERVPVYPACGEFKDYVICTKRSILKAHGHIPL